MSVTSLESADFRLMRKTDLPRVLEIERRSFRSPWDEARFLAALSKDSGAHCVVVEAPFTPESGPRHRELAGYFVLEIRATSTHIVNLAIHPRHRRRGLASKTLLFIEQVALKASKIARERDTTLSPVGASGACPAEIAETAVAVDAPAHDGEIHLEVEESNLAAQLLYRKMGYRATKILRNFYALVHEDGYRMVRKLLLPSASVAAE